MQTKKLKFACKIFFFGKWLFEYKIWFEIEKKNEKIFGAISILLGKFFKNCMKIVWLAFFHTFDVGNCMISIFGVGKCKISIFGLWRSTRDSNRNNIVSESNIFLMLEICFKWKSNVSPYPGDFPCKIWNRPVIYENCRQTFWSTRAYCSFESCKLRFFSSWLLLIELLVKKLWLH